MRIRSTKPEFWRSERIASVSWDARLVIKGIESYVDDNGVGKDDLALIVADVFPRDLSRNPTGTLQKVSEALSELSDAGLLHRYDHEGTRLLYVAFWESIQRIEKPSKGRLPRPDGTMDYRESMIGAAFPEPSRNTPGTLRPGTGEQGNRGTGEQTLLSTDADASSDEPDPFDEFWIRYPRKVAKGAAVKAWKAALKKVDDPRTIIDACRTFSVRVHGSDEKFIPHASTWLNAERWLDEAETSRLEEELTRLDEPFRPPECPPEIADDGNRYLAWLKDEKAKWDARQAANQ